MQRKQAVQIFYATLALLMCFVASAQGASTKPTATTTPTSVTNPLEAVSGRWYTEGHEGGVELYPCDDQICGRFSWMKDENGEVSRDTNNPDPAERQRPLCHMQFMGNFTPEGKNRYTGGWIYNPRDGGIYSAQMTLVDHDTLDLHGYLFIPLLGQSQTWKRAKNMPSCLHD